MVFSVLGPNFTSDLFDRLYLSNLLTSSFDRDNIVKPINPRANRIPKRRAKLRIHNF